MIIVFLVLLYKKILGMVQQEIDFITGKSTEYGHKITGFKS